MNRQGSGRYNSMNNMGPGILGDTPGLLSQDGPGGGLLSDLPGVGGMQQNLMGNNLGLISGDIEALLQQRQLAQQLSMRESQLAMATNMLQQQSKMLDGMSTGPMGNMGGGRMQGGMIPSLLDMPSQHIRKRPVEMDNFDMKRRRQDGSGRISRWDRSMEEDEGHFRRRSRSRDRFRRRSHETGNHRSMSPRRDHVGNQSGMRNNVQSPYFCHLCKLDCRNDQGFKAHMQSGRHQERLDEIGNLHHRTSQEMAGRLNAQAHLRQFEQNNRPAFCKLCDMDIPIPFQRHRLMTIHKKREQQVHRGCGWCEVKNFKNFTDVLNHRETRKHKENEKKFSKRIEDDKRSVDGKRNEDGEKSRDLSSKEKDNKKRTPSKAATSDKTDSGPKYDAETAVGQNYVISVTGFFCKLCHKFYNNETAAKVTHCKSHPHFDKWKKVRQEAKAKAAATKEMVTSSPKATQEDVHKNEDEKSKDDTKQIVIDSPVKEDLKKESELKLEEENHEEDLEESDIAKKDAEDDHLRQEDDMLIEDEDIKPEEEKLLLSPEDDDIPNGNDSQVSLDVPDKSEEVADEVMKVVDDGAEVDEEEPEESVGDSVTESTRGRGRGVRGKRGRRGRK